MELCLAFCNVYKVRSSLVEIVLHEIGSRKDTPISLLLNWACHPNQFASLTALDILKELFEVSMHVHVSFMNMLLFLGGS